MSTLEGSGRFINDGLVYYVDFANKNSFSPNMINYSNWTVGTGSVSASSSLYGSSGFTLNGEVGETVRFIGTDPFGSTQSIIWKSNSIDSFTASGGADGGWNGSRFAIDPTKMYRFSVWTKRDAMTIGNTYSGAFYLGVYNYNSSSGIIDLRSKVTGITNSNAYFHYTSNPLPSALSSVTPPNLGGLNVWTLVVGHVWPTNSPTASLIVGSDVNGLALNYNHQDSGIWTRAGGKVGNLVVGDWIWSASASQATLRTYLFYSSDITATQSFVYPRVDLIDGTEPTIQQLLTGTEPIKNLMTNGSNINHTSLNDVIYANINTNFSPTSNGSLIFNNNSKNVLSGYISTTFSVYCASVWVNFDSTVTSVSPGRPLFQLSPPSSTPFGLYIGDGTALLTGETIFLADNSGRTGVIGVNISANVWHNLVINWESTSYKIYLDGVALTTTSGTNQHVPLKTSTNYVLIGGRDNGTSTTITIDGKISSFAVWQRSLTSSEIALLYRKGKSKLGI